MDTNNNNPENKNMDQNTAPQTPSTPSQPAMPATDTPAPASTDTTTPAATPPAGDAVPASDTSAPAVTPASGDASNPPPAAVKEDTVNAPAMSDSEPKHGGKSTGLMVGALVVLIAVFVGLLFFFIMKKPAQNPQPTQQVPVASVPTTAPPTASPTPGLTEEAVNAVDIGSPESDLVPVTEDLGQL